MIKCIAANIHKPHYENEAPFDVPKGWEWCKLDDLAFYKKGPFGSSLTKSMFVSENPSAYKVYEQKNAINKDCSLGHYFIDADKYEELKGFAVSPHDIIVSCAGTIGETYVLPDNIRAGIINQALMIIRLYDTCITDFYLLYFDFILKNEAAKESKGTAIKNIPPFDILKNFLIPIPPLSEQIRIIEEVNQWLSLVQQIDESEEDISNLISKTKSKILDLAIHGKLVPQNSNEESAIELLKRINPSFVPCDNAQYQYDIPYNWEWSNLGSIGKWQSGGTPDRKNKLYYNGEIPWLKIADLQDDYVIEATEFISEDGLNNSSAKYNPTGSVALAMYGSIGKVGILTFPSTTNQAICVCSDYVVAQKYLFYYLISQRDNFFMLSGGGVQANISKQIIVKHPIPIPPHSEQLRIVSKIEELFAVLDDIQKSIGT